MRVIACYSVKGGVGKTTTAVNLAHEAAAAGLHVILWDLDAQGSASYLLQVEPKVRGGAAGLLQGDGKVRKALRKTPYPSITVLPTDPEAKDADLILEEAKKSRQRIRRVIDHLDGDADVVILDCPPGQSLLAENVLRAADVIVVPLQPSPLSLRSLGQVRALVADSRTPPTIVAFGSMVDTRRRAHREFMEQVAGTAPDVVATPIPASAVVERMGERRAPVAEFSPRSRPAQAYAELWRDVADKAGLAFANTQS